MNKYFLLLFFSFCVSFKVANGQNWNAMGLGMNDDVYALCEYNGELYAGGKFTTADGAPANHIAKWDGAGWVTVGNGLNGNVWSLAVYNGELYAGGFFLNYGWGILRWDGSNWYDVGGGVNDLVYSLCVYHGKLFVGGKFTSAVTIQANHIAQWDGVSWDTLGSGTGGLSPWVLALTTYNGKLIVGGEFTSTGGQASHYISSWNDTAWIPMGFSTTTENWPHGVYALCSYNNNLYAGGYLDTIGLIHVTNNMGEWNGLTWNSFGLNLNGYVYTLITDSIKLYVGGNFGTPGHYVTSWDGNTYSNFGTGMNAFVTAFTFYNSHLYGGGKFTLAGSNTAKKIAWWSVPLAVDEFSDQNEISFYPDPNDGNMTFVLSGASNQNRKLEFYNSVGQLVDVINIENAEERISINESVFENGIYVYHLIADGETVETGKIVIAK